MRLFLLILNMITWNMDPAALEKAFEIYPDVKLVVFVHLYGTPEERPVRQRFWKSL